MKNLKIELRGQRIRIYICSLLAVLAFEQIIWFILNLFTEPLAVFFNLVYLTVICGIMFFLYRNFQKAGKEGPGEPYDEEAQKYLQDMSERYAKRRINGIALLFAVSFLFLSSEIVYIIQANSKPAEFMENFFANLFMVKLPLYLCRF